MKTLDFILNQWNLKPAPVVELQCSRKGSLGRLFRRLGFKLGVEVGVERAMFSKMICQQWPEGKLYGVDHWQKVKGYRDHVKQKRLEEFFMETKERMKPYNYEIIRDFSVEAAKRFEDESLDFVFIDASHDYKNVVLDLNSWHKKMRKGGIMAGHDYYDGRYKNVGGWISPYGVKTAVDEWVKKRKIKPLFLFKKNDNSWMYVK